LCLSAHSRANDDLTKPNFSFAAKRFIRWRKQYRKNTPQLAPVAVRIARRWTDN